MILRLASLVAYDLLNTASSTNLLVLVGGWAAGPQQRSARAGGAHLLADPPVLPARSERGVVAESEVVLLL